MLSSIPVESLPEIGNVKELPANSAPVFRGGFIVAIANDALGALPRSVDPNADGYLVAFGTTCPHMGCLVQNVYHKLPTNTDPESLVTRPCPCHGSTFDLTRGGLVVLGPATQNLPQLRLEFSSDGAKVNAAGWLTAPDPNAETWPCDRPSTGGA